MSIYARTFACLRQTPRETLAFLALVYLLGELPMIGSIRGLLAALLAANLCRAALGQMLWERQMRSWIFSWRMLAALTLVVLPPFLLSTAVTISLPEMEPMAKGTVALLVLSACHLGWTALTGTALLSAACDMPMNLRRTLSEARTAAWPTVKALLVGPILGGVGAMFALAVLSLGLDALEPGGTLQEPIFALAADVLIVFLITLTMAALVSAWEKGHAPPSHAEVFA